MTLGELVAAARDTPDAVKASRGRAALRRLQRMPSRQREREAVLLGYRDHGGEGGR